MNSSVRVCPTPPSSASGSRSRRWKMRFSLRGCCAALASHASGSSPVTGTSHVPPRASSASAWWPLPFRRPRPACRYSAASGFIAAKGSLLGWIESPWKHANPSSFRAHHALVAGCCLLPRKPGFRPGRDLEFGAFESDEVPALDGRLSLAPRPDARGFPACEVLRDSSLVTEDNLSQRETSPFVVPPFVLFPGLPTLESRELLSKSLSDEDAEVVASRQPLAWARAARGLPKPAFVDSLLEPPRSSRDPMPLRTSPQSRGHWVAAGREKQSERWWLGSEAAPASPKAPRSD